jgi:L-fucose isomerase-like protein
MIHMSITVALAHLTDSREDFREIRTPLVDEEMHSMQWISDEYSVIASGIIHSDGQVVEFLDQIARGRADVLIIHIPIWADPIFTMKLANLSRLPTILVGNQRPETSSMVGLLGAGGSLDQIGYTHFRVFDQHTKEGIKRIRAFIRAAGAVAHLRGQTLGLFGGPSLGIFTAGADPVLWQQLFGVNIEYVDQLEIQNQAELIDPAKVKNIFNWFLWTYRVKGICKFSEIILVWKCSPVAQLNDCISVFKHCGG